MDELAKQQKLTAYMQLDSIWKKIHTTPNWAKIAIVLLLINIGLHLHEKHVAAEERQKDLVWKWSYKAALLANSGDVDEMSKYINKVVAHDLYRHDSERRERIKHKAKKYGPQLLVDGYLARDILIDNPEAHEALDRWVVFQTADPKAAEKFAESQNDENKTKHATIGN
jgi:hypothetical protein